MPGFREAAQVHLVETSPGCAPYSASIWGRRLNGTKVPERFPKAR